MIYDILQVLIGLIFGAAGGFFFARRLITKQFKDNPQLDEKTLRIIITQLGQTPSQKKLNQMLREINKNK